MGQAPAGATRAQRGPEGGGPSAGRGLLLPLRPRVTASPGPRHPPEEKRSQESRPRIRFYNCASNPANTGVSETVPERRDPGTDTWRQSAGRRQGRGARPPEAQRRGPAAGWGLRRAPLPHVPAPPGLVAPWTLRCLCSFFADGMGRSWRGESQTWAWSAGAPRAEAELVPLTTPPPGLLRAPARLDVLPGRRPPHPHPRESFLKKSLARVLGSGPALKPLVPRDV